MTSASSILCRINIQHETRLTLMKIGAVAHRFNNERTIPMRLMTTILITVLCLVRIYGQDDPTRSWNQHHELLRKAIGLEPLNQTQGERHIRVWNGLYVLELRESGSTTTGFVTCYVQEASGYDTGRIHYERTPLSTACTNDILALVEHYTILEMPTGSAIEGWGQGFDGNMIIVEHADPEGSAFKSYWSPSLFEDRLIEARRMTGFLDRVREIEELRSIHEDFMRTLPFDRWYASYGSVVVKLRAK